MVFCERRRISSSSGKVSFYTSALQLQKLIYSALWCLMPMDRPIINASKDIVIAIARMMSFFLVISNMSAGEIAGLLNRVCNGGNWNFRRLSGAITSSGIDVILLEDLSSFILQRLWKSPGLSSNGGLSSSIVAVGLQCMTSWRDLLYAATLASHLEVMLGSRDF